MNVAKLAHRIERLQARLDRAEERHHDGHHGHHGHGHHGHEHGGQPDPVDPPVHVDPPEQPAEPAEPVGGTLPDTAPATINGWTVVAGTNGADLLQGHAGVPDLFLLGSGSDTVTGYEQGVDAIWVRDPHTVGGEPFVEILTMREEGDVTRFGSPAEWLPDAPDGTRTGVVVALDSGAVEIRGMTEIGAQDWVFGAEVPQYVAAEPIEEAEPAGDWAFV